MLQLHHIYCKIAFKFHLRSIKWLEDTILLELLSFADDLGNLAERLKGNEIEPDILSYPKSRAGRKPSKPKLKQISVHRSRRQISTKQKRKRKKNCNLWNK